MTLPRHNPFSTRFVRPGAIPYYFPDGDSAHAIIKRLGRLNGVGQIVAPHGSGKSTLLHALAPELEAAGWEVQWLLARSDRSIETVHQTRSPRRWEAAGQMLLVDGWEQAISWKRLWWRCSRRGAPRGLIVSTHRDVALPTLYRPVATAETIDRILNGLLNPEASRRLAVEPRTLIAVHRGNIREILFDLYDRYQSILLSETESASCEVEPFA